MEAGLGDDVDLDGGVTARVVDGTGVDLGDGHFEVCVEEKTRARKG